MKLTSYLAAALLESSLAAASSIPKNEARQLEVGIGIGLGNCGDGFYLGPGHTPPAGFDFLAFCSSYLQATSTRTSTVTSTTIQSVTKTNTPSPVLTTSTKYSTASQTSVVTVTTIYGTTVVVTSRLTSSKPTLTSSTSISTSKSSTISTSTSPGAPEGSLCPVPGDTPQSCGVTGWGYAENNIYYGQPVSAIKCHQLCLANPDCASFQVQADSVSAPECNLYRVAIAPNTIIEGDSPFIFYDRNCPQYSPSTCKARDATSLVKKDESAIPPFLVGIDFDLIDILCQCIVSNPPAPTYVTVTKTTLVTRTNTATTVQGPTSSSVVTVTVGITTVYTATTTVARSSTVTRTTTVTV